MPVFVGGVLSWRPEGLATSGPGAENVRSRGTPKKEHRVWIGLGQSSNCVLGQGKESWAPTSRDGQDGAAGVCPGWARGSLVCTPGDA